MKPILFILLNTFFFHMPVRAEIWESHIKPSFSQGFDSTGFAIIGVGSVSVWASQTYDDEMRRDWGAHQKISKQNSKYGDYLGTGIPGAAIALTQLLVDENNGWAHAEALTFSFVTTSILKYANQRPRPNGLNRHAMPSGHTSTAFTTATSLAYAYGWKAAIPAYLAATFVALTRVSDDAHWLSDTIAGATIGIFWGRATSLHHSSGAAASIEPWFFDDDGLGVRWVFRN